MGCYLVKVLAAYTRGELNFHSDAQIYKKTVILREKNCYKLFGEKSMQRLVSVTIILCYDWDFAPCTTRNIGKFSDCSIKFKKVL